MRIFALNAHVLSERPGESKFEFVADEIGPITPGPTRRVAPAATFVHWILVRFDSLSNAAIMERRNRFRKRPRRLRYSGKLVSSVEKRNPSARRFRA